MYRLRFMVMGLSLGATLVTARPALGQQRRSASPPADGSVPAAVPGVPINRRFPFAGAWDGSRTMRDGSGAKQPAPIGMVFDIADSISRAYSGAMILPNGAHAPFQRLTITEDGLTWEQANSGGGKWVYTAKLASRDTLVGTLVLRGAPWKPTEDPSGTFALVRRAPARR